MVEADDGRALAQIGAAAFDPGAQIVLAGGAALDTNNAPSAARVVAYEHEQGVIQTDDPADGYLLLKDAWYPGWRAWLDGQAVPIERADTFFRAVRVPAGSHTVEMKFESPMLGLGAAISGVALALGCGLAFVVWWQGGHAH